MNNNHHAPHDVADVTPFETPMAADRPDGTRVVAIGLHTLDEGIVYVPRGSEGGHVECSACDDVWHLEFDRGFTDWFTAALA